ncbi:phosphatase PAP2 family protein [Streptomyces sp. NPDC057617]|uniref:phosphatase PAP2 family protein n=1 Tax=Streptomyces sp. NPDC057617 TaxID=3346184 RepID=UPI00367A9237
MKLARTGPAEREQDTPARPPLVRELLLVTTLFLVYKLGRQVATGHTEEAYRNADRLWGWERSLHLPDEGTVQSLLLHSGTLVEAANTYYAAVHFPATLLFLGWLYWHRPGHYVWARWALAALTGAALVLHVLMPLAPPRLVEATGLVDTGQVYGPSVYADTPTTDSVANQFAAMPSLHVGWALMVAVGLIAAGRSHWRWLWLLHPLITLFVVIGTANHYWLDTVVAVVLLSGVLTCIRAPGRRAQAVRSHPSVRDRAARPRPTAEPRPEAAKEAEPVRVPVVVPLIASGVPSRIMPLIPSPGVVPVIASGLASGTAR